MYMNSGRRRRPRVVVEGKGRSVLELDDQQNDVRPGPRHQRNKPDNAQFKPPASSSSSISHKSNRKLRGRKILVDIGKQHSIAIPVPVQKSPTIPPLRHELLASSFVDSAGEEGSKNHKDDQANSGSNMQSYNNSARSGTSGSSRGSSNGSSAGSSASSRASSSLASSRPGLSTIAGTSTLPDSYETTALSTLGSSISSRSGTASRSASSGVSLPSSLANSVGSGDQRMINDTALLNRR
jgi:hypothetical protein